MTTETKDMIKPAVRTLADALKEKLSISADGVPTWGEGAVETATGGKADAFQEAYAQYQVLVPAMALAVGEKALETFKDLDAAQAVEATLDVAKGWGITTTFTPSYEKLSGKPGDADRQTVTAYGNVQHVTSMNATKGGSGQLSHARKSIAAMAAAQFS